MSFLRSKGTTFTNQPIGVVTTRTGSEELYASIARDATRVTNDLLVRAKDEQIKKGQDFAMNVETRDKNGILRIVKAPDSFSDVAQRASQQQLNRIYANELQFDVNKGITQARADADGDVDKFQKLSSIYIGETEKILNAQGGSQYVPLLRRASARYVAQHQNAIILKAAEDADRLATSKEISFIENQLSDIDTLYTGGATTIDDAMGETEPVNLDEYVNFLKSRATELRDNVKIGHRTYQDIINKIDKTVLTAQVRNKLDPIGQNLDINAVNILKNYFLDGSITTKEKEILAEYDIDDAFLEKNKDLNRANRDYIVQRVNQYATHINTQLTALGKKNENVDFAQRFEGRDIIFFQAKEEKLSDVFFANKYNGGKKMTNADYYRVASTPNGLADLLKHNGLPLTLKNMFKNLPQMLVRIQQQGDKALPELITQIDMFKNFYTAFGVSGNITNNSFRDSIGHNNFDDWLALTTRVGLYGEDNIAGLLNEISRTPIDAAAREVTQKQNLVNIDDKFAGMGVTKSVDALMRKFISEDVFGSGADFNPESILYMKMVAKKQLAIQGTSEGTLKEILKNVYNAMYIESSLIYNETQDGESAFYTFGFGTKYLKSRFAPERFFGTGEVLDGFIQHVNTKVNLHMNNAKKYELGKNILLLPTKRSGTLNTAEYIIVAQDESSGLLKKDGDVITITTNGYILKLTKEGKSKQLAEIERLRKLRLKKIKAERKVADKTKGKSTLQLFLESFYVTQNPSGQ
tara:strand:- start:1510 stop:3762 length:2253 start_codon:yes stop_codon:yes gene_type:complete